MAEMILPGVYIEVRPEGLIVPGRVTVGNVGVVGTASKGEIGKPVILGSYPQARQIFGEYDAYIDSSSGQPIDNSLTLTRALEIAFAHGATRVWAVRIAGTDSDASSKATYVLQSTTGNNCVTLTAKTEGTWGNELSVNVWQATDNAYIEKETVSGTALAHTPFRSARNRVTRFIAATGITRILQILYAGDTATSGADPATPTATQVTVDLATGNLTFGEAPQSGDRVTASYSVANGSAVKVTLRLGRSEEVYTVVDGNDLAEDINKEIGGSAWVDAEADAAHGGERPGPSASDKEFAQFSHGTNGEANADYRDGLEKLLDVDAHIIVAAGQNDSFGDELDTHCQLASTDTYKRDRIAVVGSRSASSRQLALDHALGHSLASDRVIFVAPGIRFFDTAAKKDVVLPGAYAAPAVAGLLSSNSAHISPTNKTLRVGGLEYEFTAAELTQLLQNRVLALEARQGFRIVRGITTATNSAWQQITTRRIVDFAKFGVRSASNPYIGLLNNERVRAALKSTINSFLSEMVDDEMLIKYDLEVSATRDDERKGIARVVMVLQPTFSIDFIKVTMFLE
ncbi:MAG: phage tail sheath C-terminal domain-containing protein [Gammaproteobacteria bacterium]